MPTDDSEKISKSVGEDVEKLNLRYIADRDVKRQKPVCWLFKKLHIELLYDFAIPFPGVYPKEWKASVQKKNVYTHVHSRIIHSS